ncbi:hypothetical protein GALMADRAFT_226306 [Galerina marginata CBS 339.88]|uniref:FAD-binding PCMH-type domain-containing protein n=1 Tax=Galerina marginata (strain CBS 339.88) TaxID=685588 RepID=A0A067T6W5_GALM3|nr:hypothetical protein GALMADRAFT_226306 [Galerina marginata CBS 339.88]
MFSSTLFLIQLTTGLATASAASLQQWNLLNFTVGGRLHTGTPFSQPCFSSSAGGVSDGTNADACAAVQTNYINRLFRSDHFGAYELPQWETCQATGDECLLDATNTSNSLAFSPPAQCLQGSVPNYYIDVAGPNDVKAAYIFSALNQVPLVIKNTGHDYIGRSAGPGALALWTHNLKTLVLDKSFVPDGCLIAPTTAVTVGAGQQFGAIYDFALANNVTVVSGADPSVGASGGWLMGGGHSALAPAMGLGVDRVLQFKIVTPDGVYRTVNKCQNKDLFFALRGGGGGTFGVVLETTHLASPAVQLQVVLGLTKYTQGNATQLVQSLAKIAVQMAADGWGGYITPSAGSAIWANPLLNSTAAQASAAGVAKAFAAVGGTTTFFVMNSNTEFFETFIASNTAPVGKPQVVASRLIPDDKVTDETLIAAMTGAILSSDFGEILAVTPYAFKGHDIGGTSINPAFRTAVWHGLIGSFWNFDSTLAQRVSAYQALTKKWAVVRERTPGAAAYLNEGDVYEPDYTTTYWGSNYPKLLAIKKKYDPFHLLDCWHCVGWKGTEDPRYKCYPNTNTN